MQRAEQNWSAWAGHWPDPPRRALDIARTLAAIVVGVAMLGGTLLSLRLAPGGVGLPLSASVVLIVLAWSGLALCIWQALRRRQEAKAAKRALANAQCIFTCTLDAVRDAAIVADCHNRVVRMNAAAQQLTGWTQAEACGQPLDRIYHIGLLTSGATENEAAHECPRPAILSTRDGESRQILHRKLPSVDADGQSLGAVVVFHEAPAPAEPDSQEATGRLAGGVAHEFNNLLAIILGYSDVLLARVGVNTEEHNNLLEVKCAGERAAELTRQLLAFSRRQVLQPRVVDIGALLAKMRRFARRIVGEDISVSIQCAPRLWKVELDPQQFEQIMMGLLANARDAMPHGGRVTIDMRNVTLESRLGMPAGPYVMLSISDTGVGMSESTRRSVFSPFFTTKTPDTRTTGLELSMVQGIVQQSGGHIQVESAIGCGTTFRLYFSKAKHEEIETSSVQPTPPRSRRGAERVLLVEDEVPVRVLTRKLLESEGFEVIEATSSTEAIEICRSAPDEIHLLLTDVIMPQCSGSELASRIRALRPEMRVLFMSGYTDDIIGDHGVLTPGTFFLQKPFTAQTLFDKIRETLHTPVSAPSLPAAAVPARAMRNG